MIQRSYDRLHAGNVINEQIDEAMSPLHFGRLGEHKCFADVVFLDCQQFAERTMRFVVFARFYLEREHGQSLFVINKIIHFAVLLIVVVITVTTKLHFSFACRGNQTEMAERHRRCLSDSIFPT